MWILVLVLRTFSVGGTFPPTLHQAEENENITISWDVSTKTDVSHINMVCFLDSEPPHMLYHMIRGAEDPQSQDQQFAGRVRFDRDALREGRVRLHVSRVTAGDSGRYRCDLAANYDGDTKRWELEDTETFVLNVKQTAEEVRGDPGPAAGGSRRPHRSQSKEFTFLALFIGAQALTAGAAVGIILHNHAKQKDSDRDGRSLTRREVTVDVPDDTDPG